MQIKGSGSATIASIVLNSNLNAAKLQFGLGLFGDHTPGVLVNPKSLPPHAPHTAWYILPDLSKRLVPPSTWLSLLVIPPI